MTARDLVMVIGGYVCWYFHNKYTNPPNCAH